MRFSKITCEAYGSFTLSAAGPIIIRSTDETKLTPETANAIFLRSGTGDGKEAFVIPGSSIKGVVRHYLETAPDLPKLLRVSDMKQFWTNLFGTVDKPAIKSKISFSDAFTVDKPAIKSKISFSAAFTVDKPAIKSKISFSDAFADMNTVETSMRYQTRIDAITQGAARSSLNSIQAVTKGDFRCSFRIRNLNANELAVFAKAMAAFDSGELCIGGRVSRGYGMVRIKDFDMVLTDGYDADLRPRILRKCTSLEEFLTELEHVKAMIPEGGNANAAG